MADKEESVAYSGTLVLTERPTEAVFFECPGCTHFAIMLVSEPDYSTGVAFFSSIIADANDTVLAGTANSGASTTSGGRYPTGSGTSYYTGVNFTKDGVEVLRPPNSTAAYWKWFQAGTYEWIAW